MLHRHGCYQAGAKWRFALFTAVCKAEIQMNMLIYHRPCPTSVITAANLPSVFAKTNYCGLFFSLIFFFSFIRMTMPETKAVCPLPELSYVISVCRETMVGWQPCPTWPTGSLGRRMGWNSPVRLSIRAHTSPRPRSTNSVSSVSPLKCGFLKLL